MQSVGRQTAAWTDDRGRTLPDRPEDAHVGSARLVLRARPLTLVAQRALERKCDRIPAQGCPGALLAVEAQPGVSGKLAQLTSQVRNIAGKQLYIELPDNLFPRDRHGSTELLCTGRGEYPAPMFRFDTPTAKLRAVACIEGISYLVLLFVAMPLKYWAGIPIAVRVVGSIHGGLFIWGGVLALMGILQRGKTWGWAFKILIAALLPFGTFFLDNDLREDDEEYRRNAQGD